MTYDPKNVHSVSTNTGEKKADLVTSIILLVFSAIILIQSFSMKIMVQYSPGPGLFPLMIGVLIASLSLSLLFESLNPKVPDKESKFKNKTGIMSSVKMFVGLLIYALLITKLGYIIMTFLLVCYIMTIVEKSSIKSTLTTAVGVTLLLFLIFQVGLNVTLPRSPFGF